MVDKKGYYVIISIWILLIKGKSEYFLTFSGYSGFPFCELVIHILLGNF